MKRQTTQRNQQNLSLAQWITERILCLPRIIRILITAIFALMTILAVSPIVDEIYLRFFFNQNTRILPSFVTMAIGLVMYIVGWRIIVGTVGEQSENKSLVLWYFGVGLFAILIVGFWLLRLIALDNSSL